MDDYRRAAQRARKNQRAWAAAAGGRTALPVPMTGLRQRGREPQNMLIPGHQHPYVLGFWPRLGDRRLYVHAGEPVEPASEHADLWVDITGIDDDTDDVLAVTPYNSSARMGSAATLTDGRVLYVWADTSGIRQGHAADVDSYLTVEGSVTFDRDLHTGLVSPACAVARDGGRLLLSTWWWGQDSDGVARGRFYESDDDGATWSLLTEHVTQDVAGLSVYNPARATVGPPRRADDGSLVAMVTRPETSRLQYGETWPQWHLVRSTDAGASWSSRHVVSELAAAYQLHASRGIGGAAGDLYWSWRYNRGAFGDHVRILHSTDHGATWSTLQELTPETGVAVVMVAPAPKTIEGWAVVTLGEDGTVRRWFVDDLGTPTSAWTEITTNFAFPGSLGYPLLEDVAGTLVPYTRQYAGSSTFAVGARATFWVRNTAGEWVPVAGAVVVDHQHGDYAPHDHAHAPAESALALDDLTDVDAAAPADGDAVAWDAAAEQWVSVEPAEDPHVGPAPPPVQPGHAATGGHRLGRLWVDTSGT